MVTPWYFHKVFASEKRPGYKRKVWALEPEKIELGTQQARFQPFFQSTWSKTQKPSNGGLMQAGLRLKQIEKYEQRWDFFSRSMKYFQYTKCERRRHHRENTAVCKSKLDLVNG